MIKYAIVSGRITQYQADSLEYTISEYDKKTPMVRFLSPSGICNITTAENFITGTYDNLMAIMDDEYRIHREKVKSVCDRYPQMNYTERELVDYLISDGAEPKDITYEEVHSLAKSLCTDYYRECCNSLLEAYMDYMH